MATPPYDEAEAETVLAEAEVLCRAALAELSPKTQQSFCTMKTLIEFAATNLVGTNRALRARDDKIKELASRIEALETHGVKYAGIWQRALSYRKGLVVTVDGSMWIALRDVREGEQPGKVMDAWQLSEKRPRIISR